MNKSNKSSKPSLTRGFVRVGVILLVASGCGGSSVTGDDSSVVGTQPVPEEQALAPAGNPAPPAPNQGHSPPPPRTLPTFVNLDWSAFPRDRGPGYPVSGVARVVTTNGSDSNAGTTESPFRTINKALAAAGPGDLIRVHGGEYAEGRPDDFRALVLDKENLVLTAAPGETVTVKPTSTEYKYGCAIEADHVTVNGINLEGFEYAMQIGSENRTQKDIVISNLTIRAPGEGFNEGIIAYGDTVSKGFPTIRGLLIKNVSILGTAMGVSCNHGPCESWRLENVRIVGRGGEGSGADAIAVENGDNMLFEKVDVSKVAGDGIDTKATRVVVWDSHVHDVERNGVKLWHGGDIVNTRIHHTGADASVVTEHGPKVRLLHSVVAYHNKGGASSYNMTFGYDSQEAQEVEIMNSIIYNTSGGAYLNPASSVNIVNSLFHGIDNGNVLETHKGTIRLSHGARAIQSQGLGEGNAFGDPQLDQAFHLRPGSPAIDRGKALGSHFPEQDARGNPRIKGGGPDLGVFEDF